MTPLNTLLQEYSVEVVSVDKRALEAACSHFPAGTEVFIASLPKSNVNEIIEAAVRLSGSGLTPVPHIVARNITSATDLDRLLGGLVERAGVDRALVLAGDRNDPAGDYDYSLQLMESGTFEKYGIRKMYLSCYPEGHPRISEQQLEAARDEKLAVAKKRDFDVCLISQFCFDADPILRWLKQLRSQGIATPYRVGVAGPASRANLIKFALTCGVGPSLRLLQNRDGLVKNMVSGETPEGLLTQVAQALNLDPELRIAGAHFFTFGSLAKTADWIVASKGQRG